MANHYLPINFSFYYLQYYLSLTFYTFKELNFNIFDLGIPTNPFKYFFDVIIPTDPFEYF